MVSVNRTFTVVKPIEEVVKYLSDFAHAESWDPGTVTCARVDSGPVQVGSKWKNVSKFRGRETALDYRLVSLDPHRLVFEGVNKTVTSTDDLSFTALPEGTRISYTANLDFKGVIKLFGWALKGEFNKLADQVEKQMPAVINAL
ncbi:SRPBCC family protein [Nakamurella sp. PAMC28650]|uniref:SRPBCC family protein n=1 Tax=Nakamurella sp. PAMC28650 TaxID=2762325 RepID=UPI00164ED442|nr:SRPBCC family protein [Nakamurella sp. PAMC28650]QNK82747.1 SRPBCC family protein [Nakamurella sp. PAMC28650]